MDVDDRSNLQILHDAVPGRLRLTIPGLKHDANFSRTLERELRHEPRIDNACARESTGSLTVTYPTSLARGQALQMIEAAVRRARLPVGSGSHWWHDDIDIVMRRLGTSENGLCEQQVATQRHDYGGNTTPDAPPPGDWPILLRQFNSLPVWLLGASALASLASGGLLDAALIGGVVAANAAVGFFVERKSERVLQSFIDHALPPVMLRRNDQLVSVAASEVVCGDIMLLPTGSIIPADARIISSVDLMVDESMLTGESLPVEKSAGVIPTSAALADRINMLHAGTLVVSGSAVAVVVAVGEQTEIGRIRTVVAMTRQTRTPLQRQMDRLGAQLTVISVVASGAAFGLGFLRGTPFGQLARTVTALAVAAIPEGLPAVTTTILATGLVEMRRNNVLVRQLAAVETLGSVSIMCFDKTGTLTQNRMAVTRINTRDDEIVLRQRTFSQNGLVRTIDPGTALYRLLEVVSLCNDSTVEASCTRSQVLNGTSTENALLVAALAAGIRIDDLRQKHPVLERMPRGENRRYMTTAHATRQHVITAIKGNPLDVLALCDSYALADGRTADLDPDDLAAIVRQNETMTAEGLRVLGVACRDPDKTVWLGLVGMADPIRAGIAEVLTGFHDAGISTVMITGDQIGTAQAIAQQAGLASEIKAIEGAHFLRRPETETAEEGSDHAVFARVSPVDKLNIVQSLQAHDQIVAMIGDGTNDAPALRAADIGVAMGRTGTSAAQEIADVVLLDDELETMIVAVRQGRTIYANLRKAVHFLVGTNSSEVMVTLGAAACSLGEPLTAPQLLWLNLITDSSIAYGLGCEPPDPDVMRHPPRQGDEPFIGAADYRRLVSKGGMFAASALAAHVYGMTRYGVSGGGVAFSTLIASQLLDGISARSQHHPVWSLGGNPTLAWAVAGTAGVQVLASLLPLTRRLLGIAAFDLLDLAVITAGSVGPFLAYETLGKNSDRPASAG